MATMILYLMVSGSMHTVRIPFESVQACNDAKHAISQALHSAYTECKARKAAK